MTMFRTVEELWRYRDSEAARFSSECTQRRAQSKLAATLGRSGIRKSHAHCTLDNYMTNQTFYTPAQQQRQQRNLQEVRQWLTLFDKGRAGGFVMLGSPGTGKNHLASAVGDAIIKKGGRAVIVTVEELMMKIRATYRKEARYSETKLLQWLATLDLLVIDEVGIQRGNNNEQVMLNEMINQRSMEQNPTGILTNLDKNSLSDVIGLRALDRILEGNSMWLTFDWPSYRRLGRGDA